MSIYLIVYLVIGLCWFFCLLPYQEFDSLTQGVATMILLASLWPLFVSYGLYQNAQDE